MNKQKKNAFTLIELLMVIAIIGILAGILIPTVGAVRKQANIAASKSQLSNYVTAIQMFKGDYGYFPFVSGGGDSDNFSLNNVANTTEFIKTLSGRDVDGSLISNTDASSTGNRRKASYHSFAETEFFVNSSDVVTNNQIADRFNNVEIEVEIDTDGDGFVNPAPSTNPVRTPVTAYVVEDEDLDAPGYTLWD